MQEIEIRNRPLPSFQDFVSQSSRLSCALSHGPTQEKAISSDFALQRTNRELLSFGSTPPRWRLTPRVLVVDDDALYQSLFMRYLEKLGCVFEVVSNGQDAVDKIRRGFNFDLVLMVGGFDCFLLTFTFPLFSPLKCIFFPSFLLWNPHFPRFSPLLKDILMPVMDGCLATSHIRSHGCLVPIISVTSAASMAECKKYIETGMSAVLAKPYQFKALSNLLTR